MDIPIFVYGTLMKGFENHSMLEQYILSSCQGSIAGRLYHLKEGYPAVTKGKDRIQGEIYWLRDMGKVLPALDYLEDYNQPDTEDLYKRILCEALTSAGERVLCYVYVWAPEREAELLRDGVYVQSGDWKKLNRIL